MQKSVCFFIKRLSAYNELEVQGFKKCSVKRKIKCLMHECKCASKIKCINLKVREK